MFKQPLLLCFFMLTSIFLACSPQETAGGSDHPNELIGAVVDSTNKEIVVRLYRTITTNDPSLSDSLANGKPEIIQESYLDSTGFYSFIIIQEGSYYVEAILDDSSAVNISQTISVSSETSENEWPLELEAMPLYIPGRVVFSSEDCAGTLYAVGTHYQSSAMSEKNCMIPYLPSGRSYQIRSTSAPDSSVETVFIPSGSHPDYPIQRSSPQKLILLPGNSGDTISVLPYDTISVKLNSNASTGYTWEDYSDAELIAVMDQYNECPEQNPPGASCETVFQWIIPQGLSGGVSINLSYEQYWTPGSAIEQFQIVLEPTD